MVRACWDGRPAFLALDALTTTKKPARGGLVMGAGGLGQNFSGFGVDLAQAAQA